jgi:hypothetical protein
MATDPRATDVASYAAAVRSALADLPGAQAQALLEDLDDHLAEVAAESDEPLAQRLGPPATYAAELRAAYGVAHGHRPRRGGDLRRLVSELSGWLTGSIAYREVRAFLPELRPAWWVLRAYLAVLILAVAFRQGRDIHPIPNPFSRYGLLQLIATIVAIAVSVRLGRQVRPLGYRFQGVAIAFNGLIAIVAILVLARMGTGYAIMGAADSTPTMVQSTFAAGPVTNIYAYARDGKALDGVLLYDQAGNPLVLPNGDPDLITDVPIASDGKPIANLYPLTQRHANGDPVGPPRVAIPPAPSPAASPTPSPKAAP